MLIKPLNLFAFTYWFDFFFLYHILKSEAINKEFTKFNKDWMCDLTYMLFIAIPISNFFACKGKY